MGRRPVALTAVACGVAVAAVPAYAAWNVIGTGTGTATARTLSAPGAITATGTTASSATLSWVAAAPLPSGSIGYQVERAPFGSTTGWVAACGSSAAAPVAGTSCTDTGLTASTDYHYRVTSLYGNWRSQGSLSGKVTTAAPAPVAKSLAFVDCPTAPIGASTSRTLTVALRDASGAPVASGPGGVTVTLSNSNPAAGTVSPASTVIPAGSTTSGSITVTTTSGNASGARSLTITAESPGLTSATCTVQK